MFQFFKAVTQKPVKVQFSTITDLLNLYRHKNIIIIALDILMFVKKVVSSLMIII